MKFVKVTSILLVLAMAIGIISSCKHSDTPDGGLTAESTTESQETTDTPTTPKPDYTKLPYSGKHVVKNDEIGMRVASYVNSNPYVADVEITKNAVVFYCYLPGTTSVSLSDFFGHTAKIDIEVKEATAENEKNIITANVTPNTVEYIEVADFGAKGDGKADDTKAFQTAIDSAAPGETVYVNPGRYNVSLLTMREGVTLKLYTAMTDAKEGFTTKHSIAVSRSQYAILSGTRILNNENQAKGAEGCSNFSIIGGVFDTNCENRSTLIFGCADNVRLENIIFKDIKGNHTIQFTGCTNSVIENCMFAGYVCGDAFTREIIQLEPSTPGATGGPLTFENGEYNCPKNITINNCYFGKSDEAGAPLMAIGHHSQVGEANVTGLKITNNVFDEVLYAAIRYNNLVDVEITGNTFISTSKYMNATQFSEATTPAFILLYLHGGSSTYKASNGLTVTEAIASEQAGHHNIKIEKNTFNVGAGSDKRIIYYIHKDITPGVSFTTVTRQDKYTSPTYNYSGYSVNTNYAKDISFSDNTINFEGQPKYNDYYIRLSMVFNLKFENNNVNLADGVKFLYSSSKYEDGQQISAVDLGGLYNYIIKTKSTDKTITINFGDKKYILLSNYSGTLTLKKNVGGTIDARTDSKGNLIIDITPAEGYTAGTITTSSSQELKPGSHSFSSNTVLNFTFKSN